MSQISYQQALDPYHTAFRFLRLKEVIEYVGEISELRLFILDFYLLFPSKLCDIQLKASPRRKYKETITKYENLGQYSNIPDPQFLLQRMFAIQSAALGTLKAKNFFSTKLGEVDIIVSEETKISDILLHRVKELNAKENDLIEIIKFLAKEINLSGKNGLKSITGLMEYRYDAV